MTKNHKYKILIVEDDEDVLDVMESIVQNLGFKTVTARNGADGFDKFTLEKPDLVLSDIKMPQMDGIQMAHKIKDLNEQLPIILFSGVHGNLLEEKANGKIKCDHLLYKPFIQQDIMDSLQIFFP